jgi:hypothetical protein
MSLKCNSRNNNNRSSREGDSALKFSHLQEKKRRLAARRLILVLRISQR